MFADGRAIEVSKNILGNVVDIDIFSWRLDQRQSLLVKNSDGNDLIDGGFFMAEYNNFWVVRAIKTTRAFAKSCQ